MGARGEARRDADQAESLVLGLETMPRARVTERFL